MLDIIINGLKIYKTPDNLNFTLGGSEIASFLGKCFFTKKSDLIRRKILSIKNKPNVTTNWGNLFEEVIREYSEYHYNTKIIKPDSLYFGDYIRYSPDGIGIINEYIGDIRIPKPTLFEFKCPLTRKGSIPVSYKFQIKMGLQMLSFLKKGLLIEAEFKKCSIESFNKNDISYDSTFHKALRPPYTLLAKGIILFCGNDLGINLGEAPINVFEDYLNKFINNDVQIIYSVNNQDTGISFQDKYNEVSKNLNVEAFLPWKLLKLTEHTFKPGEEIINDEIKDDLLLINQLIRDNKDRNINDLCEDIIKAIDIPFFYGDIPIEELTTNL